MPTNNTLINLGELSEPATVLIEKISDATGGIFKPWQIKRIAKAEAEAEKIKTASQIETTKLQQRALHRFLLEEAKKQKNIERITSKALPQLEKNAKPNKIEEDWIVNFFDKSRLISDTKMQELWSKILAGEANKPGSFSKRTINAMASLDKEDAIVFTKLCNFNFNIKGSQPLIFSDTEKIYIKNGIDFGSLQHLSSIGLISFESLSGYIKTKLPKKILITYQEEPLILEFKKKNKNELNIGQVLLTSIGLELAKICMTKAIEGFDAYVISKWANEGVLVSCPYNHPAVN